MKMAGPDETPEKKQTSSTLTEDQCSTDQESGGKEEKILDIEAGGEDTEVLDQESAAMDQADNQHVDVQDHEDDQPQTNGNTASDTEHDIDVADVGEAVQPEETDVTGEEPDAHAEEPQQVEFQAPTSEPSDRLFKLPLTRIKHIIKMDPDVSLASQEAVVAIAKSAEMFIAALTKDATYKTLQSRRKVVLKKDLEHTMDTRDCYAFLEGAIDS